MKIPIRYFSRGGNTKKLAEAIKSTYKQVAKLLSDKEIPLAEEELAYRGPFAMLHRGKSDADDCKAAAEFAKQMITERD